MPEIVEVRCPQGPQRLFTKLRLGQITPRYVQPENLIEFTCADCAKLIDRNPGTRPVVVHRFNFLGELVETLVQARTALPASD